MLVLDFQEGQLRGHDSSALCQDSTLGGTSHLVYALLLLP